MAKQSSETAMAGDASRIIDVSMAEWTRAWDEIGMILRTSGPKRFCQDVENALLDTVLRMFHQLGLDHASDAMVREVAIHVVMVFWLGIRIGEAMLIRALSVWQPHASLIADGWKLYETRPRPFRYRGPLVICAAKHRMPWDQRHDIARNGVPANLRHYFYEPSGFSQEAHPYYNELPFGMAVCIADLSDCRPTGIVVCAISPQERALGDFTPGRFALELENIRKFDEPFPVRGQQGLFNIELPDKYHGMIRR